MSPRAFAVARLNVTISFHQSSSSFI
ncbi:hypothetical protein IL54_2293 [Sphingobium sp. ba1]|nr:hypothetical protein IL54_2293 [Sphingobium sp. ba1]